MRMSAGAAFVAVWASGSAALAMTQDEALVAIRQEVGGGGSSAEGGVYVWMALGALALAVLLLVMRWRRGQRERKPVLNDPGKLIREMRREAGLSRADVRRLRRDAAEIERKTGAKVGNPLVMVLCPSLKGKRAA